MVRIHKSVDNLIKMSQKVITQVDNPGWNRSKEEIKTPTYEYLVLELIFARRRQ